MKKQTNLYLTVHARKLLKSMSNEWGVSMSALVEMMIRNYSKEEKIDIYMEAELDE